MHSHPSFTFAGATDPGRRRTRNEDRFWIDGDAGLVVVVDGVGGHAGGEEAAELAVSVISAQLKTSATPSRERLRAALIAANNAVYELASAHADWEGTGCVVTAAIVADDTVTVGHVGDSRLYKFRPGAIVQITRDHSFVGELEQRGELSEIEALQHPRRNEVFRALGDKQRSPADDDFVDVTETPFDADCALLFCTDGLSDLLTLAQLTAIIESHAGDPEAVVKTLIDAANEAGGKDNITVAFLEGPQFASIFRRGAEGSDLPITQPRSARAPIEPAPQTAPRRATQFTSLLVAMLLGASLGALALYFLGWREPGPPAKSQPPAGAVSPRLILVGQSQPRDFSSIQEAILRANPGDTILVDPGEYGERIVLTSAISVVSRNSREAIIRIPSGAGEGREGVTIRHSGGGRFAGFRIVSEDAQPLAVGLAVYGAATEIDDMEVSGCYTAGIELAGGSTALVRASYIHDNGGAGILIKGKGHAKLTHNLLLRNGTAAGNKRAGVEIVDAAAVTVAGNTILENGIPGILGIPAPDLQRAKVNNVFDSRRAGAAAESIRK